MFIGHFALGFAAKKASPQVSLGVLFVAAQWADLLWPVLVAVGVEQVRIAPGDTAFTPLSFVSYPYSHSLVMLAGWGLLLGWTYARSRSRGRRTLGLVAALVVSHWVLDFVTHRADMPVYPGGPRFGLGLWNSVPATLLVETAMYIAGVWIYARATRPRDAIGRWAFVGLVALLATAYAGNVAGGAPPSVAAIWIVGLIGGGVILVVGEWADRHREPVDLRTPAQR